MPDPTTKAHAAVDYMHSEHRRQIREKNQKINALQAEKGELQRALQDKTSDPRPLTPDAIEVALRDCMPGVELYRLFGSQVMRLAEDMHAALTEPPKRPAGAERWEDFLIDSLDYQALTDQQITDLADRIAEEMNR